MSRDVRDWATGPWTRSVCGVSCLPVSCPWHPVEQLTKQNPIAYAVTVPRTSKLGSKSLRSTSSWLPRCVSGSVREP